MPPDDVLPPPDAAAPGGGEVARAADDPLGTVAIVLGCVGIVVAGIVFTLIVGVLASIAGAQARARGRSLENAYLAFGLAAVDGVVWLVLHMLFEMNFLFG